MSSTLKLVVSKKPFEVMKTGEKVEEFRRISKWMDSRLYNKDGTKRHYDLIQFSNGYRPDSPRFIAIYEGFDIVNNVRNSYSNKLNVSFEDTPTYVIQFRYKDEA